MTTRRRFIQVIPFASAALVAACSRTPEPAAPPPASVTPPAPIPAPATAPAAAAPASEPAPRTAAAPPAAAGTALPLVDEKDPQAIALGYVDDAARVDKAKYPNYQAGSHCGNCALFQGKAGDAAAPCPLYAGKQVSAKGWCSAWNKKV